MKLKTGTGIIYRGQTALMYGRYTIFLEPADRHETGIFEASNQSRERMRDFVQLLSDNPSLVLQIEDGTGYPIRVEYQSAITPPSRDAVFDITIDPPGDGDSA